jgi:hypothetical protein
MAVETTTSTQTTQIDPTIQPYLKYGLEEAQRLYQAGGPQYYQGQGYVSPSAATQTGIQALQARAQAGNPLLGAAQNQLMGTVQGDYLGGNPFFSGAFQPAAQAATTAFNTAINDVTSQASKAGRYGSGAMQNLQGAAAGQLAQKLTGTAGQLAYQNYADERARQQAATFGAPAMAEADYADINKQLAAGQLGEGYQNQALQADMAKYAYEQNLPQSQLTNYLNQAYGFPAGKTQTSQTPYFTNPTATALGTGLLGVQLLGGLDKMGTGGSGGISSGLNWLTSGWGGNTFGMDENTRKLVGL